MITYNVYRLVHLFGIFSLFLAFGVLIGSDKGQARWGSILHGVGLLIIAVSGFGILARLGIHGSFPAWVIGKLVIWLLLGVSLSLAKRKILPSLVLIPMLLILGSLAGHLAIWKS